MEKTDDLLKKKEQLAYALEVSKSARIRKRIAQKLRMIKKEIERSVETTSETGGKPKYETI